MKSVNVPYIVAGWRDWDGAVEQNDWYEHGWQPFDRLADRRRFINPGSVGMPYGGTGAYWALLGPGVSLQHTVYDIHAAAAAFRTAAAGYPGLDDFVANTVITAPSDAIALAAFSP